MNTILLFGGFFFVFLGMVGAFVPVMPTTPFLLLAAVCFAKSSKKAHNWILTNRWCGEYIRNYQEKRGMALRHKAGVLVLLWLTIGYSALFVSKKLWLGLLLIMIAAAVTVHILMIPTYRRKSAG